MVHRERARAARYPGRATPALISFTLCFSLARVRLWLNILLGRLIPAPGRHWAVHPAPVVAARAATPVGRMPVPVSRPAHHGAKGPAPDNKADEPKDHAKEHQPQHDLEQQPRAEHKGQRPPDAARAGRRYDLFPFGCQLAVPVSLRPSSAVGYCTARDQQADEDQRRQAAISKSRLFFRVKRPARLRNRGYDLTFPP